jgi:hypothetical protein
MVSNNPHEKDHLAGRGTRERIDLGRLGVATARIAGPQEAVTFVALEAAREIRKFRGWLEWDTPTFRVDSDAPVEIGIDGEALLMEPPLLFESLPGALRVRIAKGAPGVARAAKSVHLTPGTIAALGRAVLGRPAGTGNGVQEVTGR